MQVIDPAEVERQAMEMEGARGVTMRVLIGPDWARGLQTARGTPATSEEVAPIAGAPTFVMRLFEVARGGHTPMHAHDWEHEVFVLEGEGELASPESRLPLRPGVAAFVPPGETHQFVNTGDGALRFLCIVPLRGQPGCAPR